MNEPQFSPLFSYWWPGSFPIDDQVGGSQDFNSMNNVAKNIPVLGSLAYV